MWKNLDLMPATCPGNLSLALGSGVVTPWQLASSYTVLANGGYRVEPFFIERIETYTGDLLFQAQPATVCPQCPDNGCNGDANSSARHRGRNRNTRYGPGRTTYRRNV